VDEFHTNRTRSHRMADSSFLLRFGQRVRDLREAKGLSQEAFAEECRLDRTYISGVERGKRNIGIQNVRVIAKALGVSLSNLFEGL
jgi:transcriptional regulator with XRE-family HTH domain